MNDISIHDLEEIVTKSKLLEKALLSNLEPGQYKTYRGERAAKLEPKAVDIFAKRIKKNPNKYPNIEIITKKQVLTVKETVKTALGEQEIEHEKEVYIEIKVGRLKESKVSTVANKIGEENKGEENGGEKKRKKKRFWFM